MPEEILEATPAGVLDKAKEVVDAVVSLPTVEAQVETLQESLGAVQQQLSVIGIVEFLLVIAVIYLLWKSFKK